MSQFGKKTQLAIAVLLSDRMKNCPDTSPEGRAKFAVDLAEATIDECTVRFGDDDMIEEQMQQELLQANYRIAELTSHLMQASMYARYSACPKCHSKVVLVPPQEDGDIPYINCTECEWDSTKDVAKAKASEA